MAIGSCSELNGEVACPRCGAVSELPAGVLYFQWGLVPSTYTTGDRVKWLRTSADAPVPPLRLLGERWNAGFPARHVYAFDVDEHHPELRCSQCGVEWPGAIAADIRDDVIEQVRAFLPEELERTFGRRRDGLEQAVEDDDGTFAFFDEWRDQPFQVFTEVDALR